MAAESSQTMTTPTDAELVQAQADLWRHSLSYLTPMALRCAIQLGIPTAIHRLGGAASLADLVTTLSLPPSKQPFLGRLLRLLAATGVLARNEAVDKTMIMKST
ncbi:hypothetical protein ZWY2020_035823 [Hordeum vulgare]|nr:hypothetical protein ZWY2020_035823 [Hordeum vulgare]